MAGAESNRRHKLSVIIGHFLLIAAELGGNSSLISFVECKFALLEPRVADKIESDQCISGQ
jgi:hypothetical protein